MCGKSKLDLRGCAQSHLVMIASNLTRSLGKLTWRVYAKVDGPCWTGMLEISAEVWLKAYTNG